MFVLTWPELTCCLPSKCYCGVFSAIQSPVQAGYYISPEDPDAGPSVTDWSIERWESVQKPIVILALLDSG
jgi:hypothetical protein